MNHQASRVTNICEMRKDFQIVDEPFARFESVLESEGKDRPCAFGCVFLGHRMIRVAREGCILNPTHLRVFLKVLSHAKRVLEMPVHAHSECFNALQKEK